MVQPASGMGADTRGAYVHPGADHVHTGTSFFVARADFIRAAPVVGNPSPQRPTRHGDPSRAGRVEVEMGPFFQLLHKAFDRRVFLHVTFDKHAHAEVVQHTNTQHVEDVLLVLLLRDIQVFEGAHLTVVLCVRTDRCEAGNAPGHSSGGRFAILSRKECPPTKTRARA